MGEGRADLVAAVAGFDGFEDYVDGWGDAEGVRLRGSWRCVGNLCTYAPGRETGLGLGPRPSVFKHAVFCDL